MPQRSLWKLLVISFFAFLVVACKPIASFSVSPDPVQAGVEATFDASSTVIYNKPKNNAAKSYAWDFGDGSTGSGKVVTHTYAVAGTFKVKLTVIDTAGRKGETTESLVVGPADATTSQTMKVIVQGAGGVLLSGAQVTVGSSAIATTDETGVASLNDATIGDAVVVKVTKTGFVPQTLRVPVEAGDVVRQLFVPLIAVKEEQTTTAVELARQYRAETLGASVTLPANALVIAGTNTPAMGAARLQLTPWNINDPEMRAMPGNGRALNSQGIEGDLISAGMMTVDFFDASGNKLQLAPGKNAVLQMDLPYASVNNQPLAVGSLIPLWHFNENTGLWAEEGEGVVVASSTSPVGLAVKATVSHFSTWNWDYYITEGGPSNNNQVVVKCVEADGTGVPCTIVADVTLPDGSKYYHHGGNINTSTVSAEGLTIVLLPLNANIVWTGTTADGRVGTAQSGPDGTVNILMSPPKTNNFVQCVLPSGTASTCVVQLDITKSDNSVVSQVITLPATGARVVTSIETTQPLNWAARTGLSFNAETNEYERYIGSAMSNGSENVTITLSDTVVETGKTLYLKCDTTAEVFEIDSNTPETQGLDECRVTMNIGAGIGFTTTVSTGTLIPVSVPPSLSESTLSVNGSGVAADGTPVFTSIANAVSSYADDALIPLSFSNQMVIEGPIEF